MDFGGYADVSLVELGFQFRVVDALGFLAGIYPTVYFGAAHHQFREPVGHPLRLLGCH